MANRFLNNIRINDSYTLPAADGTENQVITTDGAGQLSFVDQSTVASGSSRTVSILVKNISSADGGVNLSKGDPVYIYGSVGASERLYVDLADAGDSSKMPCVALLDQNLSPNGEGTATVTGKLKNLITSPIDGATPTENDTLYVKSGGGLTLTKPTGPSNLIQNVGQVGRVSTSSDGNIVVSAILRSNDVPNLPTGRIWVGDGNTVVSDVVYLDETNERMGIGTASPSEALHVVGTGVFTGDIGVGTTSILGGAANRGNITVNGSSDAALAFGNGGTLKGFILQDSSGMTAYSDDAIYFYAGGSERMRINSLGDTSVFGDLGIYTTHGTFHFGSVAGANDLNSETALSAPEDLRISADNHIFRRDTAEHMRITSAGNVGIGTTSPTSQLSNTSVNSTDQAGIGHSSTAVAWRSNNQGYTATFDNYLDSTISNGLLVKTANTGTASYISKFESGGINRMAIRSDGNVGIGTTSPGSPLHVAASGLDTSAGALGVHIGVHSSTYAGIEMVSAGSNSGWIDFLNVTGGGDYKERIRGGSGYFEFHTNGGERMRIDSSGKVGIGTTSPRTKLHVTGLTGDDDPSLGSSTAPLFVSNTANSYGLNIGVNNLGDAWLQAQSNTSAIAYDILLNPLGGNVGIGTTSPLTKLHLDFGTLTNGDINELVLQSKADSATYYSNSAITGITFTNWSGGYTAGSLNRAAGVYGYNADTLERYGRFMGLSFYTSTLDAAATEKMRIDHSGNVGIGTTSPAYQLQLSLNSAAKPTSSSWTVVSDERVKTNIQDYTTGLTEILQINPKTFDYNGKAGFDTTTGNIGIIAQDVISIMPETINTYNAKLNEDDTEDTELFNFDSHPVQFALINAIKELNSKIEALEARIQILENQ
jgi:hypothetical protein